MSALCFSLSEIFSCPYCSTPLFLFFWQACVCLYPLLMNVRNRPEQPISFLLSSVRVCAWKIKEAINRFSWNLVPDNCNEIWRKIQVLVKIEQKDRKSVV
jgi:hypothetical protein